MFGLIGDLLDGTARLVGTVAGIAIAPVAIALGVSERMVRRAVQAGCRSLQASTDGRDEAWRRRPLPACRADGLPRA